MEGCVGGCCGVTRVSSLVGRGKGVKFWKQIWHGDETREGFSFYFV